MPTEGSISRAGVEVEIMVKPQIRAQSVALNDPRLSGPEFSSTQRSSNLFLASWSFLRRYPVIPGVVLLTVAVAAIFAGQLAPQGYIDGNLRERNTPPAWIADGSSEHLLGTDQIGRDLLGRIIYGARVTALVSSVALLTGTVVGTLLGLIAGYYGGWADEAIMRLVDIWLAMPFLLIALIVAVVIGQSVTTIIGLLALAAWSAFVRNIRAEVLSLKTRDYVALSQISGASTSRILFKHIIPGVSGIILVIASLQVGSLILSEATLSYLGAGIPGPTPAWGLMVSEGQKYISTSWWLSVFPGGAIFLVVMAFNFLGDWLRDRFDPRLSQQQ